MTVIAKESFQGQTSLQYKVIGHDLQIIEVQLQPAETVIAEAGAMVYMDEGITFESRLGDGADDKEGMFGKLMSAGKRVLSKESLLITHFTNQDDKPRTIGFASPYLGSVQVLDLWNYDGPLYCQKGAFLAASKGVRLSIALTKKIGSGFFGGEGFILQKIEGDGRVFLHGGGTIQKKVLNNQTIKVDSGSLIAFTSNIDFDIEVIKDVKSILFAGEGLFLSSLSGTGMVWIQSMPFSRLADRIHESAPKTGGKKKGES